MIRRNKGMRVVLISGAGLVLALIAIQLVPVDRSNPLVTAPLQADAAVMEVMRTSCYDCHSNETVWPWYSYVAPVSWLVASDVHEGREHLNFSRWGELDADERAELAEESIEEVEEGHMPLPSYIRTHPDARLGGDEFALLRAWAEGVEAADSDEDGGGDNSGRGRGRGRGGDD